MVSNLREIEAAMPVEFVDFLCWIIYRHLVMPIRYIDWMGQLFYLCNFQRTHSVSLFNEYIPPSPLMGFGIFSLVALNRLLTLL